MASRWTFGGNDIYVTDNNASKKNTIARLQPVEGGTVLQFFGHEDKIIKLKGYVVGSTILGTLEGYAETDDAYTLMEGIINHGAFYVSSINYSRVPAVYQTLTNDCDDPLYLVDLELYP